MADIDSLKEEYRSNLTQCIQRVKTELDNKASADDLTELQTQVDIIKTNDKTITGSINEINGNLLDTVGFSADYKNIILNRKNGLNPYTIPISAIINNASLTELKDIDSTDIGNGKTLVYDNAIQKHKYVDSELTDELVKMEASSDSEYLADLIDKNTIVNDKGVLKVKKLDGQEVTIAEINHLKGLTMNIVDLVKSFSNGGVKMYEHTIATYADLLALDRSEFVDGIRYFVYVLADETHGGIKTTYICDKTNTSYFGVAGDDRDFTTEPIDLANEVTGKLGVSNIDVDALWKLVTVYDTYKTLTTKNEPFGTHGANAMYNELVAEIGKKSNTSDLTTHTSDTNIHVTKGDKLKWDRVVDKVENLAFSDHKNNHNIHITADERTKWNGKEDSSNKTTAINSTSTDEQYPSAKAVYDELNLKADRGNMPDINPSHFYIKSGLFTSASTKVNFNTGNPRYFVINGICYVNLWPINITENSFSNETILNNLPKAKAPASCIIFDIVDVKMLGSVWIEEGKQILKCTAKLGDGVTKETGYARFSYPVDKTWTPS